MVLEKLKELGPDPKQFGLHSLRAGGASAAANAGVPDRWFKRHGSGSRRMPRTATSNISLRTGLVLLKLGPVRYY